MRRVETKQTKDELDGSSTNESTAFKGRATGYQRRMHDLKSALDKAKLEIPRSSEAGFPFERYDFQPRLRDAGATTPLLSCHRDGWARKRILCEQSSASQKQAYSTLRTQVLHRLDDRRLRVLGITSPLPGAGKTLTSINLAIAISRTPGRSAMLIDLDLRRPSVHRMFGFDPRFGLDDYLGGTASIPQALGNPGISSLTVLPVKNPVQESAELIASREFAELLMEMRNRYSNRVVVIDLPPVLASDDVLALTPCMEASLLVIEAGRTKKDEIVKSVDLLRRTTVVGTVLNKAEENLVTYY